MSYNALTRYKKEIQKSLCCCGSTKARLLERFDRTLAPFLAECPDPDSEMLYAAFGPPESTAGLLMSEMSLEEVTRYRRKVVVRNIVAVLFAVLFFVTTVYVYFIKQAPIEVVDEILIDRTLEIETTAPSADTE